MTYEDAKELFNNDGFKEIICHSKLCNYKETGCSDCQFTHMSILIEEALEKQIPKRPIGGKYSAKYWCPSCDSEDPIDIYDTDFCPYCGQAIDWRVKE